MNEIGEFNWHYVAVLPRGFIYWLTHTGGNQGRGRKFRRIFNQNGPRYVDNRLIKAIKRTTKSEANEYSVATPQTTNSHHRINCTPALLILFNGTPNDFASVIIPLPCLPLLLFTCALLEPVLTISRHSHGSNSGAKQTQVGNPRGPIDKKTAGRRLTRQCGSRGVQ